MTKILNIEALEAYLRKQSKLDLLTEHMQEDEPMFDRFGHDVDDAYNTGMDDGGVWECRHILKTFFDAEGE